MEENGAQSVKAFIGVGSNIEPERNIVEALSVLASRMPLLALSSFYFTVALQDRAQCDYINGVVLIECHCSPKSLKLDILRPIEKGQGRVRSEDKYASRPIDLDLLAYGDVVVEEAELSIPDPDLREHGFLQVAMLEVAPDFVFPDTGEKLSCMVGEQDARSLRRATEFTLRLKERFCHE